MKRVLHKIPFYSQYSEADWQERGFDSLEDAILWQERSCGIACVKMVLDMHPEHAGKKFYPLIKEMEEKGVYKLGAGCVHQGIANELNDKMIDSQRMKITNINQITKLIDQGNIFIVSIGAGFTNGRKTGHLIPVVGYIEEDGKVKSVITQYTTSAPKLQQVEREVDSDRFMEHFSGNAIRVRVYNE
jgi:hypothetical protein